MRNRFAAHRSAAQPQRSLGRIAMLKRVAALLALTGVAVSLAACNTVEGAGKDIKATGNAIEKAADSAKPK
jgi:predicted small secreted protein